MNFKGREVVVEVSITTVTEGNAKYQQLLMHTENWIIDNHVPLPGSGGPQLTLMEEKALREEAERAVSHA